MKKDYLYAGELAKKTGVSTDTLRYYERKGVLEKPPRSAKGYRLYSKKSLDQVKLVRSALSIGFSIDEIASIFEHRRTGNTPCLEVRQLAANKLAEVENHLKQLSIFRNNLQQTLQNWDKDLAKTPKGKSANLLEKLADTNNNFPNKNSSPINLKKF